VVLLDVGFLDRRGPANVRRMTWDATGCLERWYSDPRMDEAEALALAAVDPGWPAGVGEPDLLVSANIISQLDLLPAPWLAQQRKRADDFSERLGTVLAKTHLAWMNRQAGHHLIIGDLGSTLIPADGSAAESRDLPPSQIGLPTPDRTWDWELAPIPEWNRTHHLRHHVGAWFLEPSG